MADYDVQINANADDASNVILEDLFQVPAEICRYLRGFLNILQQDANASEREMLESYAIRCEEEPSHDLAASSSKEEWCEDEHRAGIDKTSALGAGDGAKLELFQTLDNIARMLEETHKPLMLAFDDEYGDALPMVMEMKELCEDYYEFGGGYESCYYDAGSGAVVCNSSVWQSEEGYWDVMKAKQPSGGRRWIQCSSC